MHVTQASATDEQISLVQSQVKTSHRNCKSWVKFVWEVQEKYLAGELVINGHSHISQPFHTGLQVIQVFVLLSDYYVMQILV